MIIDLPPADLRQARAEPDQEWDQVLAGISPGTPHFSYYEFERPFELLVGRRIDNAPLANRL